jgi:hypothetical protein
VTAARRDYEGRVVGMTNSDGIYEIQVAPGIYYLHAVKSGFLPGTYGERYAGDPGRPVAVRGGSVSSSVDLRLLRGGAIEGRVIDARGEPVASVVVTAWRTDLSEDISRAVDGSTSRTDDRGRYRLHSLPPGSYAVDVKLAIPKPGEPRPRSDGGPVGAGAGARGNLCGQAAGEVLIGPEADMAHDIQTEATQDFAVSGAVLGGTMVSRASGQVAALSLRGTTQRVCGMSGVDAQGQFGFVGLPPGAYKFRFANGDASPSRALVAVLDLPALTADVEGLQLSAVPAGIVRGTIDFLGRTKPVPTLVQIVCRTSQPDGGHAASRLAVVKSDHTFELTGIDERCRIDVESADWRLRSVAVLGGQAADAGVEASPGQALQVRLSLTEARSVLEGRLVPIGRGDDYEVVVFPEDPARWHSPSGWIGVGRPDASGTFRVANLPAGPYFAAVRRIERALNATAMEDLRRRATRVVLREGLATDVTLSATTP